MGLGKLKEITEIFSKEGKSNTAIALIQDGSLPTQKIALGTIETIVDVANDNNIKAPAVIVIGEVVKQNPNFESLLKNDETKLILKSLINFIENFAKKNNINKIVIDIHNNLERFNYELKNLGFIITEKISLINPFWLEAEKII
jgi:hypothetical protein